MSEILSTRQASKILKMTQSGVTYLLREGRLDGQKLGREWAVFKKSLLAFKAEREKKRKKDD